MYPENPGVEMYKKAPYIVEMPDSCRQEGRPCHGEAAWAKP